MDTLTIGYNSKDEPAILVGKSETFSSHLAVYRKLVSQGSPDFVRVEVWRSKIGRVKNKAVFTPEKLKSMNLSAAEKEADETETKGKRGRPKKS